jgi:hypothetical protein
LGEGGRRAQQNQEETGNRSHRDTSSGCSRNQRRTDFNPFARPIGQCTPIG